jgi:Uridine phosphorylase
MGIIDTFDSLSEEILRPGIRISEIEGFPETVVVVFKQEIIDLIEDKYNPTIETYMNAGHKIPVYRITYKGIDIAIYKTIIGGAGSAGLLEEMIAFGGKKFVFFGSCGTLDKNISEGHFIIPTAAYRDEGTSYHYVPASDYIEISTADKLGKIFSELDIPFVEGKTWTTDAIYRETRNNMLKRKADGCITVEMESASIMAVGQFRNVEVYQYLYGEDTLDGDAWDPRTMGKVPQSDNEKYLLIALEVAIRV